MTWQWSQSARRYKDSETGRFMSRDRIQEFVDASLAAGRQVSDVLATMVSDGSITPEAWNNGMRQEIKDEYIRQYILGRGGRDQMDASDWGSVGGSIRDQYKFLEGFLAEIEGEQLSEAQIRARAAMYIESAREAFEKGNAKSVGVPVDQLPAVPGDGSTVCLTNCRCRWDYRPIVEDGEVIGWNCFWILNPGAEHCTTCQDRAAEWSPFVIMV
jgi:hypothetical protein